ncbi:MAG: HNH endonuclease [Myxococcaceae bacterium]
MDEALGFSLWSYCHERLRMPESTATRYSRSAALLVRFPAAVEYLRDGRLNATTLGMLEKVLTPENHVALLTRASGLSMKLVEELLAELNPRPDVRETTTFVPDRRPLFKERDRSLNFSGETQKATSPVGKLEVVGAASQGSLSEITARPSNDPPHLKSKVEVLGPGRLALWVNLDKSGYAELEEVRSMLSHLMPTATDADLIRECIHRTRKDLAKKQRAELEVRSIRSRTSTSEVTPPATADLEVTAPPTSNSEVLPPATSKLEVTPPATANLEVNPPATSNLEVNPPYLSSWELLGLTGAPFLPVELRAKREPSAEVIRAVYARDEGRCAFVGLKGHRCNSRHQLQLDHWRPWALGGEATLANSRLLCRRHNIFCAIQVFGEERMRRYLRTQRLERQRLTSLNPSFT